MKSGETRIASVLRSAHEPLHLARKRLQSHRLSTVQTSRHAPQNMTDCMRAREEQAGKGVDSHT